MFRLLRWSRTWSLLTVGGTLLCQFPLTKPSIWVLCDEQLSKKTRAKKLSSTSAYSLFVVTGLPASLCSGDMPCMNIRCLTCPLTHELSEQSLQKRPIQCLSTFFFCTSATGFAWDFVFLSTFLPQLGQESRFSVSLTAWPLVLWRNTGEYSYKQYN